MTKPEKQTPEHLQVSGKSAGPDRLPCRGCMRDCSNYASCDGRPWRIGLMAQGAAGNNSK